MNDLRAFIAAALLFLTGSTSAFPGSGGQIKVTPHQLPILLNRQHNPVMSVRLHPGGAGGFRVEDLSLDFTGTMRISDIRTVRIFLTGRKNLFDTSVMLSMVERPSLKQVVRLGKNFQDTLEVWLSLELSPDTDMLHTFSIALAGIHMGDGLAMNYQKVSPLILRAGIAVRQHMQDGVHTHRIPGLVTTAKGTLLAIWDARRLSSRDLQGDIDIAMSRSIDGGRTWLPAQVVLDMKQWGGLPEKFNGVSDANILVDRKTGDIHVAGLWMHGVLDERGLPVEGLDTGSRNWNHQWRDRGSQPGHDVRRTSQFLMTKSTDDGKTWSKPVNMTPLKDSSWWLWAPAPGHGITLRDGTLVMPTQGRDASGVGFSNISYSRDNGRTWRISKPARSMTSECMAVQLSDGGIMLNMRTRVNRSDSSAFNGRAISVTYDMGETWSVHPGSGISLIEPACMASLHKHENPPGTSRRDILFFSNPSSGTARIDMTIKASLDDGTSWPKEYWLLLDDMKSRGYSCLTSVDVRTLGILYESSQADLVFQKIALSTWPGLRLP